MKCMFCQSDIKDEDILKDGIETRIAGQKTSPLEYNCPECIHVWLTESCAGRFPGDPFFQDPERRMILSRCIRKLCEQSNDKRLQSRLSVQRLNYLWLKR